MTWRRIIVGVDFSEASLAAARWIATDFAPDAELILVNVVPTPDVPAYLPSELSPSSDGDGSAIPSAIHGGLRGLAELIRAGRVRVRVSNGSPADALVRVATQCRADLICVGRGRRRRGSARFGATTSQRLLARNRLPTLIVPAARLTAPSRVIAAVDDRHNGRRVLDVGRVLGAAHEAHIDALHVIEKELLDYVVSQEPFKDRGAAEPYRIWGSPGGSGAWLRSRARDWVVDELREVDAGIYGASATVQSGDAGQEIIRRARETNADLIVIGRGGAAAHDDVGTTVPVGSTARMVAWAAPCPVLVLPLEPLPVIPPTSRRRHSSSHSHPSSPRVVLRGENLAS